MKVLNPVIFQGHVFYIVYFLPFTGSSLLCLLWRHLPLPCMPATHLLGWPLIRQPSRSNWPVSSGLEPVLCTVLYVICVPSSLTWDSSSMIVVSSWLLQDHQYFLCFVLFCLRQYLMFPKIACDLLMELRMTLNFWLPRLFCTLSDKTVYINEMQHRGSILVAFVKVYVMLIYWLSDYHHICHFAFHLG